MRAINGIGKAVVIFVVILLAKVKGSPGDIPLLHFFNGCWSSPISPLQPNHSPPAAFNAPIIPTARPPALAFCHPAGNTIRYYD
jgi:hypothetical protein